MSKFEHWFNGYWSLYDDWHDTKKKMVNLRIEWCPAWFFLVGISMPTVKTVVINLLGFDIRFHWLGKAKKYWGKNMTKKDKK